MTVSYQYDVASSASGGFIRLLFRWRGSVWKVVYREMLLFTVIYVLLSVLYHFAMTDPQQKVFEKIVYFCSTFMDLIPLSFMLGFYVSFIAARWWSQFIAIPWPDKLMNIVAMYVPGLEDADRVLRRTLMRYLNLSLVLVLRSISMAVKRRFPTKEHLVEAGFMTKTELEMFQSVPSTEFNTFWIPCTWFINVLREARHECRITDSNGLKLIMEELNEFRSKCGLLWGYDWISIPLVYTQVVTMATYAFFVACMFGRQNINTASEPSMKSHRYDYYVPIFTILQLMFYMGLLKVAEQLINPFGDDDEDFELNWIIDRHMKVSYLGVDTLNSLPPPLVRDSYYNELDVKIPYTEASRSYKKKTYRGSVAYMQVPMEQQGLVLPDMSEEDDEGDNNTETMGARRPSVYTLFGNKGKGASPSGSFGNLDNESLDLEWKGSTQNLAAGSQQHHGPDAKNASGTLGPHSAPPIFVEMPKAEDDEMVLQEVKIEPSQPHWEPLSRSDSLQVPDASGRPQEKKSSSLVTLIRQISPKIPPKFPREKLKSMFRKSRKMSAMLPFYKIKGVSFGRKNKEKEDDDDDNKSESLIDIEAQTPLEVEITLSTPELSETEKLIGVPPYQFLHRASSPSLLVSTIPTLSRKTTPKPRRGSQESVSMKEEESLPVLIDLPVRSHSLPNIQETDEATPEITEMIRMPSLRKQLSLSRKDKGKKRKQKKKSPPPPPPLPPTGDVGSDLPTDSSIDPELETADVSSRRNTLPQITVTRYEQRSPDHLDLATSISGSPHSSGHSSDSGSTTAQKPQTSTHGSPASRDSAVALVTGGTPLRTSPASSAASSSRSSPETCDPNKSPVKPSSKSPSPKSGRTSPQSSDSSKAHSTPHKSPSPQSSHSQALPPHSSSSRTSSSPAQKPPSSKSKPSVPTPLKMPKSTSSPQKTTESAPTSPTIETPSTSKVSISRGPSFPSKPRKSPPPPRSPRGSPVPSPTLTHRSQRPLPPPRRSQQQQQQQESSQHMDISSPVTSDPDGDVSSNRRRRSSPPVQQPPTKTLPPQGSKGRKGR